eukprot:CAMPEP_0183297278 /NCGR_PEP_ID=MMETSP0160_2-20130417/4613_1 /TAXON_ID=2839 ORGANISM="Odontella Sinensis, Strain Grunow 1884" /NCGR_SAMPLE_ID=MMETSP0160_2 /ASSEMBLY_ACC=CAM_ASM_000250 /LENGTH=567 /DNA_ID=CAMNT_0025459069 /DNA_START=9 /DNA_END=1712 /DNA_ORIENTATION=+
MKFASTSVSALVLKGFSAARSAPLSSLHARRSLAITGCPGADGPFTVSFDQSCNYDNLRNAIFGTKLETCTATADEVILSLLTSSDVTSAREEVRSLCVDAYANAGDVTFPFANINNKGDLWDNEYYSGGTYYNYETETDSGDNRLKEDAARIRRVYEDQAQHSIIEFPSYLPAIDPDQDGCDINSAFCCWVQDRQAGDNNGNCNTPYEAQCIDKDPADNANFCYTDHSRSRPATHVEGGFSIFVNNGHEAIEGPIHCHGLAWADDESDISNAYKGNNLFYVSLFDHMYQRGYVRNAPGSTMCGCSENMAVVTRADCTEISAQETFTFTFDETSSLSGVLSEVTDINFNSCQGANNRNNDLEAYVLRLAKEGRVPETYYTELQKTLVGKINGQCNNAVHDFMESKGIYRSSSGAADGMMAADGAVSGGKSSGGVPAIDPTYEKAYEGGDNQMMPDPPTETSEYETDTAKTMADAPPADDGAPEGTMETFAPTPLPTEPPLKEAGEFCEHGWECMSGNCLGNGKCSSNSSGQTGSSGGATCAAAGESCNKFLPCCEGECSGNPRVCPW